MSQTLGPYRQDGGKEVEKQDIFIAAAGEYRSTPTSATSEH